MQYFGVLLLVLPYRRHSCCRDIRNRRIRRIFRWEFLQEDVEVENLVGLQKVARTRAVMQSAVVNDAVFLNADHHADAADAIIAHILYASMP
jgi:hypothetical protein